MEPNEPEQQDEVARIPLVKEDASVSINRKRTATVRVETSTNVREDWVRAELRHSDIEIQTVPMNIEITEPPEVRVEGETTIIPVLEERIVVEKRLFLKEELHVTRRQVVETVNQPVLLREQHVSVERIDETKEQ